METYSITRFYAPHINKDSYTVKTGLTLEEAQEHCQDDSTACPDGEWFDGYNAE